MVSIVALSAMLTVVLAGCKKSERKLADGNYAVSVTLTGGSGTTLLITISLMAFILTLSLIITKIRIKNN